MTDLMVFQNTEFGELGVLDINGKVYFPATRCAKVLGYTNPQKAIRDHCKGVNEMLTPSNGGQQTTNYIPEGDLYRLITHSRLPAAERFERWVFDEVIPTLRKTGTYSTNSNQITIDRETLATIIGITVAETLKQTKHLWDEQKSAALPMGYRMESKSLFCEKFNELLRQHHMTPADAARLLDKSRTSVHYWTSGKHAPHPGNLKVIANRMGVSVDYFFEVDT